ncbi:PEP-CTERM sorting domain-containing protein [Roseiconus nitratireducens]|uniref:PEP-CTERM sorting domain-containing protein n=1 Tax=Roseiconus nitratireducens TaxID=2605748 RepID=A0A5M6DGX9_9BACT|nr:MYXO-CTERM sorting domain-containing protein [Roseiconus nitratireducens]KAA5545512.1 PEP-CTERM sorting domain-containing protein [Roseiconus nitratireducens]
MSLMRVLHLFAFAACVGLPANAGNIVYDADVTPDVIFGAGNANGAWTINQMGGVELGLRAKLRFDATNQPQNIFNSNGAGTYTFLSGQPTGGGFGFASGSPSTAVWNFEWSINSDVAGTSGVNLDDLIYELAIDFDPTSGTDFLKFDPINQPDQDHAIGNNSTANGGGESNPINYASLIANNNVAQNSWNMEFFDSAAFPFNANQNGQYTIRLTAFDVQNQTQIQTEIQVNAVPEPTSMGTFAALALVGVGGLGRRRRPRIDSRVS